MKSTLAAIVILVLGAGALYWFATREPEQAEGGGWQAPPPTVEVAPVEVGSVVRSVEAVGTLRANESVTLRPEIAGRVSAIHFEEGQPVTAGQLLVSLDDSVYAAEVREKEADRKLAALEHDRARQLVDARAAPVEVRDRALAELQAAEAAVDLARARLDKTRIRAPFSGTVGLRRVSVGDFVNVGQDLVNLVEIDPLKVDFRVGEVHLPSVAPGQTIEVAVDAFPERRFSGEVYAIEPLVDVNGRAVVIRARLPNEDGVLRPGLFSRVELIIDTAAAALLVPESAIVPRGDQHFVYRLVDGRALLTEVLLGKRESQRVQIVEGIAAGDVVITAGQLKLRDGVAVAVPQGAAITARGGEAGASGQ
ncbi:MAG TPA: efflux RND transporter periplasmic adaptor subunit [Pseudomonadales bacterium]